MPLSYSKYVAQRGAFKSCLLFLFHLAWRSRIKLPILIAIGFMVLDIRMQLEINIDLGRARDNLPRQDNSQENLNQAALDLDTDSEMTYSSSEESATESCTRSSDSEEDEKENSNNLFQCGCTNGVSNGDNQLLKKE